MTKYCMLFFLLFAALPGRSLPGRSLPGRSLPGKPQSGKIILKVEGIDVGRGGEISAGIFVEENFPKVGGQALGAEKVVTASTMQIVFDNVPAGSYGIVAFQDVNRNKDLETNFVGYPTEPIGFSNEARIKFGPPAFEDARVTVQAGKTLELTVILK